MDPIPRSVYYSAFGLTIKVDIAVFASVQYKAYNQSRECGNNFASGKSFSSTFLL